MKKTLLSMLVVLALATGLALPAAAASGQGAATGNTLQKLEGTPMMKAYLENDLKIFEGYLDTTGTETLTEYLTLAVDQQRIPFTEAILKRMPEDWSADDIVETMVKGHAQHMVRSLLDYTSAEKHAGWLDIAIANGDADPAACLLEKLPNADTKALADQVYQNIRSAKTRFASARHIAVFEVFRPRLSTDTVSAFYDQAVKDGEKDFVAYLDRRMA